MRSGSPSLFRQCGKPMWLVFFGLVLLAGCDKAEIAHVNGTTEFDGGAIPTGTRLFFQQPGTGYVAAGVVGDDGSFVLKHKGSEDLEPGEYIVFVGPPKSTLTEAEFMKLKAKVDADFKRRGKKPPRSPDWILPERYYDPGSSEIRKSIEVGENQVQVTLED